MPTADCLTDNPVNSRRIFKLQNKYGNTGILALFNLDGENAAVTGTLCPCDIPGLCGDEFAVYEHFSRTLQILKTDEALPVTLQDSDDYRLYVLVPMKNDSCIIGDARKFISPAAICNEESGITLKEPGLLARVENRTLVLEEIK